MGEETNLDRNCDYLLQRYDGVEAIIKYGSKAFGTPTKDSLDDYWILMDDVKSFHNANVEKYQSDYQGLRWMMKNPKNHVRLNKNWANFYQIRDEEIGLKIGVINLDSFVRACESHVLYVSGRMQKAVKPVYFKDKSAENKVQNGIKKARTIGADLAISLLPELFDFADFANTLVGLSYKADFRPLFEARNKEQTILDSSIQELGKIYDSILTKSYRVENVDETLYRRRDSDGFISTKVFLFLNKIPFTLLNIKNGITNNKAYDYMKRKRRVNAAST